MYTTRTITKMKMVAKRGNESIGFRCDCCGQRQRTFPHMHELIARRYTMKNELARNLSFQPEVCSILCSECHQKADTDGKVRDHLFIRNFGEYGYEVVLQTFTRIANLVSLNFKLPEKPEND